MRSFCFCNQSVSGKSKQLLALSSCDDLADGASVSGTAFDATGLPKLDEVSCLTVADNLFEGSKVEDEVLDLLVHWRFPVVIRCVD